MGSSERDELGGWKGDGNGWASLEGMNWMDGREMEDGRGWASLEGMSQMGGRGGIVLEGEISQGDTSASW